MTTISDRLAEAMKKANMTQADLHRKTGFTRAAISKWVNGQSEPKDILTLSGILGVTPEWLQFGKNPQQRKEATYNLADQAMTLHKRKKAPIISYVQAGNWVSLVDAYPVGTGEGYIEIDDKWSDSTFVLRVRGDSMNPTLTEGSLIVVDPCVEWMHNRIVVVRQNGDTEVTVKRLIKDGDTYYLKPDNTNYRPIELIKDSHICGVVVEQVTKFI
jgi:SOS-response transcriptional repressor LexA